jgi:hypothetical protein
VGSELKCTVRFGKETSEGKALLETSEVLFRGEFRLKIPFSSIKSVNVVDGELRIAFAEEKRAQAGVPFEAQGKPVLLEARFALGAQAEKWREKILHPKTRMEKIGVKAGAKISLLGEFEKGFFEELESLADSVTRNKVAVDTDAIFFAADSLKELSSVARVAKSLKGAAELWIVYPKGQKTIRENDVIAAGRKASLKDVKVVGFSATHTALKFVIPLDKR